MTDASIAKTALLGDNLNIGTGVRVMDHAIIHDNVTLEDGVVIGPYTVIGEPLQSYYQDPGPYRNPPTVIGKESLIRSHGVIYAGSVLGENFQSGHSIVIREHSRFGNHTMFGSFCQTDEKVTVGQYSRCHSRVFLTGEIEIGDYSCLYPGVVTTDVRYPPYRQGAAAPVIGSRCVLGAGTLLLSGIRIGDGAFLAAGSLVTGDIPENSFAAGRPARVVRDAGELKVPGSGLEKPYPFDPEILRQWKR